MDMVWIWGEETGLMGDSNLAPRRLSSSLSKLPCQYSLDMALVWQEGKG